MADKICYWDSVEKRQKERDATPEEQAEIEARRNPPLDVRKVQLIAKVQTLITEKSRASVVVGGVTMSPDDTDLVRALIAKGNAEPQRKKVLKSGQAIIITPAVVDAVLAATDALVQGCEDRAYDLMEAINAAATVAELPDVTAGWPGL
jgi:hypothetical protein